MSLQKQIEEDRRAEMSQLINFIPEQSSSLSSNHKSSSWEKKVDSLSGRRVREFYEKITTGERRPSCHLIDKKVKKRGEKKRKFLCSNKSDTDLSISHSKVQSFLGFAERGELESLKKCYEGEPSMINIRDSFGWSALMCAAHSGHVRVVKFLIECGVDTSLTDKQGRDAEKLARIANHGHVVSLLCQSKKMKCADMVKNDVADVLYPFFCDICRREFSDIDKEKHNSSTVHLFNLRLKPKPELIGLPSKNVGFQMMLRSGWDLSKGLGPDGKGRRQPIKTVLKQDRKGLGNKVKEKPQVTHFHPNDESSVRSKKHFSDRMPSVRTLSKRALKEKEKKERQWEKDMRIYMSLD